MPGSPPTTARMSIPRISDGDPVQAATQLNGIADQVDATALKYASGTSAARLAATNVDGYLWRETDTGLLYLGTGSTWVNLRIPAAWQSLTLGTNIVSLGNYTPSARLVGDRVELKGSIQSTAAISNGAALFTVPSSCKPASQVILNTLEFRGAGGVTLPYPLAVDPTSGTASARSVGDSSFANGSALSLDGIGYSLS